MTSIKEREFGIENYSKFSGTGTYSDPLVRVVSTESGFGIPIYDYIDINKSGDTENIYTYKTGGVSGVVVATLTLTYSDSTKELLLTVAKT